MTDNQQQPVIKSSDSLNGLTAIVISNNQAEDGDFLCELAKSHAIDFVLLAGYLRKIPVEFIKMYPKQIINIHPSLLPKYGGKGMYGLKVHEAVKLAAEKETGITIHWVNENFDEGGILAQFHTEILATDTVSVIANKVQKLEHAFLPWVLQHYITNCE